MPTAYPPPVEAQLIGSSSSRVTSQLPRAMHAGGGEGDPDEFKEFTDQELRSRIKRLSGLQRFTPDGGQKLRRLIYRVEKELDRRRSAGSMRGEEEDVEEFKNITDQELKFKIKRLHAYCGHGLPDGGKKLREYACRLENELDRRGAAGPCKDEGDADELKNFTDQDLRLKTKRLRALDGSTPSSGKKLRKVEKELDRHHATGVETGQSQAAQTPNVDDPYAFVQQGENTSNHAPPVDSKATDGGLNPFASTNPEGEGATGTNLGAEVEPTTSTCSGQKGEDTGKRDEHSQTAGVRETNLGFKIKQTQKLVEEVKETPKQEDRFTIEKCVAVLEAIKELTDMEKAKALKLFKRRLNREIFMTTKSATVRLIWLKSEIYA